MSDTDLEPERVWERGWDGHELAQLRRMARLPLSEKLDWLEQAQEMVLNLQKSQSRARSNADAVASADSCGAAPVPIEGDPLPCARRASSEAP